MTDMTQAPTPGPLSGDFNVEEYVADYEFRADEGSYSPTENERALLIDAIHGAFSEASLGLAPPAPVEASGSEREHGPKCWGMTSASDEMAHCYCGSTDIRTQPSGETRDIASQNEASGVLGWFSALARKEGHHVQADWLDSYIASIHPAPVASGGQHSSGEMRVVPRKPTDKDVSEILYNINRKRSADTELSEADVREVMDNYFYNVGQPDPTPVAETAGEAVAWDHAVRLKDSVHWRLASELSADMAKAIISGDPVFDHFECMPLYAAPVPAQDDDKLRIAVEALESAELALSFILSPSDPETMKADTIRCEKAQQECEEALAALKSTAAQEGVSK